MRLENNIPECVTALDESVGFTIDEMGYIYIEIKVAKYEFAFSTATQLTQQPK
jgi:hypothetical protein